MVGRTSLFEFEMLVKGEDLSQERQKHQGKVMFCIWGDVAAFSLDVLHILVLDIVSVFSVFIFLFVCFNCSFISLSILFPLKGVDGDLSMHLNFKKCRQYQ